MITRKLFIAASFCCALFPLASSATVFTVYDEAQNNLPENQAWLSYASNGVATSTVVSGIGVDLQTDDAANAGFSNYPVIPTAPKNPSFPVLNSATGFTLSFSMQLLSESHSSNNRAGFSVILLDENNQGVELGFWQDSIWSQSAAPLFLAKDELAVFDTADKQLNYDLTLFSGDYFLTQNNHILLSGELKDYSAFTGGPLGTSIPYSLPNYLFLGDDTSSASANVRLGRISLSDTALFSVPAPSSVLLISLGLLGLFCYYPKKRQVRLGHY